VKRTILLVASIAFFSIVVLRGQAALNPFAAMQNINFQYKVEIPQFTAKTMKLWVPYPAEDKYQKIKKFSVRSSLGKKLNWSLKTENKYKNKMIYFELSREDMPLGRPLEILLSYDLERTPAKGFGLTESMARQELHPDLYIKHNQWLKSNNVVRKMALEATKQAKTQPEKIKALYDYVFKIMRYDKKGKGWGKGDPIWACTTKRGNCTDFHSLYISMAREIGIAARFEIGVPIPNHFDQGVIPGYHCWAEAFDSTKGWVPFDASEAKKANKKEEYFGSVPSDRILFSVGRNIILSPPQKAGALNYFIYPYAEVDGKIFDGIKKEFSFKRI